MACAGEPCKFCGLEADKTQNLPFELPDQRTPIDKAHEPSRGVRRKDHARCSACQQRGWNPGKVQVARVKGAPGDKRSVNKTFQPRRQTAPPHRRNKYQMVAPFKV